MTPVERLFAVMTKPWVAASYLGVVLLSFLYWDKPLAIYLHAFNLDQRFPFLGYLTWLGESKFYLVALLILTLSFRYVARRPQWAIRTGFLWLCVLVSNLICLVLKVSFGRARPELWFNEQVYGVFGFSRHAEYWSFPSGHTTTIMAFVFGLSFLFPRYTWFYWIVGCMVVASRVLLLQHYLSDVLMAADLALLEVGLLWLILRRKAWFSCYA